MITTLINGIGSSSITESKVDVYLRMACTTFSLQSWCEKNVYPHIHDIFTSLKSNKTDDVICQRIALCRFKVISITGDVLFASLDSIVTVRETANHNIEKHAWPGKIQHTALPSAIICGLACSEDYCTVLLTANVSGVIKFGTTALLSPTNQIFQMLSNGTWYGPWFDIMTQEFWMATGTAQAFTLGIFDPSIGTFDPKLSFKIRTSWYTKILSGQILDRILYLTLYNDPHVYSIDLTFRIFRGNFSAPNNTMLVGNPVTNKLYGYSPSPLGIYLLDVNLGERNRTTIISVDLSGWRSIPASTVNPVDNTMWISLYGSRSDRWLHVTLSQTNNFEYLDAASFGLFDFNPYTITSVEV